MNPWDHLVEGTDERLRRLKRRATTLLSLRRYIAAQLASEGPEAALVELVEEYKILPDVEVNIALYPEDADIEGFAGDARQIKWTRDQLAAGNMYAWSRGVVGVRWLSRASPLVHVGHVSARNERDAIDLLLDHDMATQAARDLVSELPRDIVDIVRGMGSNEQRRQVKVFLRGKENEDWVRYE